MLCSWDYVNIASPWHCHTGFSDRHGVITNDIFSSSFCSKRGTELISVAVDSKVAYVTQYNGWLIKVNTTSPRWGCSVYCLNFCGGKFVNFPLSKSNKYKYLERCFILASCLYVVGPTCRLYSDSRLYPCVPWMNAGRGRCCVSILSVCLSICPPNKPSFNSWLSTRVQWRF